MTALLVNRVGHVAGAVPAEYYLVPIDECYKLVGLIRTHWRGLSGGTEVWREIGAFFATLKKRAGFGRRRRACLICASRSKARKWSSMPPRRCWRSKCASRTTPSEESIHTIALRAQIQIEATRRKYDSERTSAPCATFLANPIDGARRLRSMLWTHASVVVPRFTGSTVAEIPVPCTFDFNVARHQIFSRLAERRLAAVLSVQRNRFLSGRRRDPSSRADFLGQRSEISACP